MSHIGFDTSIELGVVEKTYWDLSFWFKGNKLIIMGLTRIDLKGILSSTMLEYDLKRTEPNVEKRFDLGSVSP